MATFLRAPHPMSGSPTIERFMTPAPHTIGFRQTLAAAHRLMSEHGIRHLPVLDSGKLVGILSQRDLHLIETLRDVNPEQVEVSEAMTPAPYTVTSRASLRRVAAEMATHKYGSAVVLEKARVVGVFTTVDALRALSNVLGESRRRSPRRR
jgi:acetoin utilization protein AcuB